MCGPPVCDGAMTNRKKQPYGLVDNGAPFVMYSGMTSRLTAALPLLLSACAPHYEWVEAPSSPAPQPDARATTRPDVDGPRTAQDLACEGSTNATRAQARQGRFRGVEGFNSRGCVRPGPWKSAD